VSGPVLITGARAPVAIDLARAFRAAGCDVVLADSVNPIAARWSKHARVLRLPPPRFAFAAFSEALAALVARERPQLIVPTCEEVFYVAAAAAHHGFEPIVFAPPPAILRQLHSKLDFAQLAAEAGAPAPQTWRITSRDEADALPLAPQTLVFKPEFSRFGAATLIGPDMETLGRTNFARAGAWAAQRRVCGEEICIWTACRAGEILAHAAYRPRWRHGKAAAFAFEAVEAKPVVAAAQRIARHIGATGQLSFDMIMDADGRAWPLECNPRAVSGLHLFDADPALARAILGEGPPPATASLRYLAPAMLLLGLPQALVSARIGEWRADWARGRDVLGRPGDRAPAFGALADAARFAAVGFSRRRSPAGQTTDDIEWNGEPIG
jgi:predicted ATP-grasp superfamily ATP-dependent carboligase